MNLVEIDVRNKTTLEKIRKWFELKSGTVKAVIISPYPKKEGVRIPYNENADTVVYVNDDIEYEAFATIYSPMRNECVVNEHRRRKAIDKDYADRFYHEQYWWLDYYREQFRDCITKNAIKILDPELYRQLYEPKELPKELPEELPRELPRKIPKERPKELPPTVTKEELIKVLDQVIPYIIAKATGKSIKQSKTIWTNILAFILFIASIINPYLDASTKQAIANAFAPILALINIWLRFKTWQPIRT